MIVKPLRLYTERRGLCSSSRKGHFRDYFEWWFGSYLEASEDIVTDVTGALDALGSTAGNPEENAVKKLESGMKLIEKSLTHICNIIRSTDEEQKLQEAMIDCYEDILNGMEQALITIQARKTAQSSSHVYNNRK